MLGKPHDTNYYLDEMKNMSSCCNFQCKKAKKCLEAGYEALSRTVSKGPVI